MRKAIFSSAIGMTFGAAMLAAPAQAAEMPGASLASPDFATMSWKGYDDDGDRWEHSRNHKRHGNGHYDHDDYSGERMYRDTPVWRGRDGRAYCRKKDGTTGLIIGGAAGALLGRAVDNRGDRTLGTVLGAAGGALIGREIERGGSRCR